MPKTLSQYYLWIGRCLRYLYFSHIRVVGEAVSNRPTLFIASHRNGALDGFVYMQALGNTPSLVSVQLIRKWFLRIFFTGIAVVREKDCQRYGIDKKNIQSPVTASVEQIRAGGRLCIYPEGTSAWEYKALSYHGGMAAIVTKLKRKNIDFVVQPVGVFYSKPDGFRSRASIILGKTFMPSGESIKDIQQELSNALDEVSVNCDTAVQFNTVQTDAWHACRQGQDFGSAFLHAQNANMATDLSSVIQTDEEPREQVRRIWAKYLFVIGFPLVAFGAKIAARGSDGRNNLSFFRIMGAVLGSLMQLIVCLVVLTHLPIIAITWFLIGLAGWCFYPEPHPVDL